MTAPDRTATVDDAWYELTLAVRGVSDRSTRAIAKARHLCDSYMNSRYHLSVVDLQEYPAGAFFDGQAVVGPTLVKNWPLPPRKFVGDLSQIAAALVALDLPAGDHAPSPNE